jgi:hypothetical protein
MKNKLLLLSLILVSIFSVLIIFKKNDSSKPQIVDGSVKFVGTIVATNDECRVDGICSIKVDDKWVVSEFGGLRPTSEIETKGRLIGISFGQDTQRYVGKKVEVFAKPENGGYTIYGDSNFYIKLLD